MEISKSFCRCFTLDKGVQLIVVMQVINAIVYLLEGITFNAVTSRAPIVTMYFIFVAMYIFIRSNERRDVFGSRMLLYYFFCIVNCVIIKVIVLLYVIFEGAGMSNVYCDEAVSREAAMNCDHFWFWIALFDLSWKWILDIYFACKLYEHANIKPNYNNF